MEVIYEVRNKFRITHIPDHYAGTPGHYTNVNGGFGLVTSKSDKLPPIVKRSTPFVLDYRKPGDEAGTPVEHVELTDDLFEAFLSLGSENRKAATTIAQHLSDEFKMSEGMLKELLNSPPRLRHYIGTTTETRPRKLLDWIDAWENKPQAGENVLVCVPRVKIRKKEPFYDYEVAYVNPDGWFNAESDRMREDPHFYMALPKPPKSAKKLGDWKNLEEGLPTFGVEVFGCFEEEYKGKTVMEIKLTYCNPDGWFNNSHEQLNEPVYIQALPMLPPPKEFE